MLRCFEEYYRVLQAGALDDGCSRVWNAIQEAMQAAGFVVASVRTLDKRQGSYQQVTSTVAKQDGRGDKARSGGRPPAQLARSGMEQRTAAGVPKALA